MAKRMSPNHVQKTGSRLEVCVGKENCHPTITSQPKAEERDHHEVEDEYHMNRIRKEKEGRTHGSGKEALPWRRG